MTTNLGFTIPTPGAAGPGYATTIDDALQKIDDAAPIAATSRGVSATNADNTLAFTQVLADAAAAAPAVVVMPAGVLVSTALTIPADNVSMAGAGQYLTTVKAKDSTDFQNVISYTGRTGIHLRHFTVDVNQANRSGVMTTTAAGVTASGCTDSSMTWMTIKNTLGTGSASANGLAFGGVSTRCFIKHCTALNLGIAGKPSDAFYISGGLLNGISHVVGSGVTDTVGVLEGCSLSAMRGVDGDTIGCLVAITSLGSNCYGNSAKDGNGHNWTATVSGGIHIASLGAGNLSHTRVSGFTLINDNVSGTGPAFNVRKTSTGKVIDLKVGATTVVGAGTQGFLIQGEQVHLYGFHVEGVTNQPIYVQTGCAKVKITNGTIEATTGQVAILTDSTDTTVDSVDINGNPTYGVYGAGTTTTGYVQVRNIGGHATYSQKIVGSDAGTSPLLDIVSSVDPNTNIRAAIGSRCMYTGGSANTTLKITEATGTAWVGK